LDGSFDGAMLGDITPILGVLDGMSLTGTVDGTKDGSKLPVGDVGDELDNGIPGSAGAKLGPLVGNGTDMDGSSDGDMLGITPILGIADGMSSTGTVDGTMDGSTLAVVMLAMNWTMEYPVVPEPNSVLW
jgi:hypothetical protein